MTNKDTAKDVQSVARSLAEPFPEEMEKVIVKSGVELVYLPISEVINRLNKALGVDGWSFEIISVRRDEIDPDELVAHVSLTATIAGTKIVKHGFGGQSVKRQKSSGKPVDLGNDFKGAVSDALKKAAQQLGVGLYLARSADAMDAEDAMEHSSASPHQSETQAVSSEVDDMWSNFVEITKGMTKEQKDVLGSYWDSYSGGRPKPTKASANEEDMQVLIQEALKIVFASPFKDDEKSE